MQNSHGTLRTSVHVTLTTLVAFTASLPRSGEAAIPDSAKPVLTALQRIDGKTTTGVSFKTYDTDIESLCGDLAVFLASPDAKKDPVLCMLFTNARDCHLKIRTAWNLKIMSDSPWDRYKAGEFMIYAPSFVWKTASQNTTFATQLANQKDSERASIERTINSESEKLTLDYALKKASEFKHALEERERKQQADAEAKVRADNEAKARQIERAKQIAKDEEEKAQRTRREAEEEVRKAAKAAREANPEGIAAGKLKLAKALLGRNPAKAKQRLAEIVKDYPRTAAAQEAVELLKGNL